VEINSVASNPPWKENTCFTIEIDRTVVLIFETCIDARSERRPDKEHLLQDMVNKVNSSNVFEGRCVEVAMADLNTFIATAGSSG
jgi:hypothetical protein